eukprot:scaffold6191_cov114-Amphora_coffeaeformis.AAC.2
MSDFEEMIEEMMPRGTRMRRGDTQEEIGSQGLAGIEQVQGEEDPLSGDGGVDATNIIGGQEDVPCHGDTPKTDPTTGGGMHDLDKFNVNLLQDYTYCVEQLGEEMGMNYQTTPIYSLPMIRVINPTTDKCKGMFVMALLHYLLQCV